MNTSAKLLLAASILAALPSLSAAATYQWDTNSDTAGLGAAGGVTASWSGANWDLVGTAPDDGTAVTTVHGFTGTGDIALFGGTAGTVTVDQAIVPRTLQFAADGYTLATNNNLTGGVTLTFNIGTSFQQRSVSMTGTNASFAGNTSIQGISLTVDSLSTLGTGPVVVGAPNGARSGSLTITELGAPTSTSRISINYSGNNPASLPTAQTIKNNSASANTLTLTNNIAPGNVTGVGTVSVLGLGGSNTGNNTVSGIISNGTNNTTGLSKVDGGTWVLTGTNTYGGTSTGTTPLALGTTISAGKLITGNTSALGVGNLSVNASGTLQVGDGTVNTVTLGSAATLAFADNITLKLGATTSQITMGATGTFSIGNGVNIDITGLGLGVGNYILVDGVLGGTVGSWSQGADLIGGNFGSFNYDFKVAGNDAVLSVTAVPEPGALSALLGGTGVLLGLRRRRA